MRIYLLVIGSEGGLELFSPNDAFVIWLCMVGLERRFVSLDSFLERMKLRFDLMDLLQRGVDLFFVAPESSASVP